MILFCKIFRNVVYVLTILVLICGTAIIGPKLFGFTPYIATSGSMEPTIPTGSLVYVNTRAKEADVNDIIMFRVVGTKKVKTVTHRVVGKISDEFVTKGDANEEADAKSVSQNQIVGKYAYHIPKLGFIYDKLGYKTFIVVAAWIIILNGLAFLLSYLFKVPDKKKKKKVKALAGASAGGTGEVLGTPFEGSSSESATESAQTDTKAPPIEQTSIQAE